MSSDPDSRVLSERTSAIENEIPSYRAISKLALISLLFGALSVLCFTSLYFLAFTLLAVGFGWLAGRRVRQFPDLLTGGGFAQTGIALALTFGLCATTIQCVQLLRVHLAARNFSKGYARVLAKADLPLAYWYHWSESQRKDKDPRSIFDEAMKSLPPGAVGADPILDSLKTLTERLKKPGSTVRFKDVEQADFDRLTPYAFTVFEIESPGSGPEYALVELRGDPTLPGLHWTVSEVGYPYQRKSHQLKVLSVEEAEHGHSH